MAEAERSAEPVRMTLDWLPGRFVVCRFAHDQPLPRWVVDALAPSTTNLVCVTRTDGELSLVIDETKLPIDLDPATPVQRDFIALRIAGIVDFALIGVFSRLTAPLAAAGVSVFLISTYDTDLILVREKDRARAIEALQAVAEVEL